MGIRIENLALIEAMHYAIESTANSLFSSTAPQMLHYYTRFDTAQSIIRSRSLWATCLASQKNDDTELFDAIKSIKDEAERVGRLGIPPLSKAIIERVGSIMELRRQWNFITCFCGDGDSQYHWTQYGEYRFDIPSNLIINRSFQCGAFNSQQWIQPVIYDRRAQNRAVKKCFEQILDAQTQYIAGEFGGLWMNAMAYRAARDVAQLLLRIAVSFKNERFKKDKEWRLVFCPNLAIGNSAPTMADEEFAVCIKMEKVRHINLQLSVPTELFQPRRVPEPPFKSIAQSSGHDDKVERETLNRLLRQNGAAELECELVCRSPVRKLIDLAFRS